MSLPAVDRLLAMDGCLDRLLGRLTQPSVLAICREPPVAERILGDPLELLATVLPEPGTASGDPSTERDDQAAEWAHGRTPGPSNRGPGRPRVLRLEEEVAEHASPFAAAVAPERPRRRVPGITVGTDVGRDVGGDLGAQVREMPGTGTTPETGTAGANGSRQGARPTTDPPETLQPRAVRPVPGGGYPGTRPRAAPDGPPHGAREAGWTSLGGSLRVSRDPVRAAAVLRANLGPAHRLDPPDAERSATRTAAGPSPGLTSSPAETAQPGQLEPGDPAIHHARPDQRHLEVPSFEVPGFEVPAAGGPDDNVMDLATAAGIDLLYDAFTDRLRLDVLRAYGTTEG